jgi:hypothetical protein
MKKTPLRLARALATALLLVACATTTFNATWKNPEAQALSFKPGDKVLAMIVSRNEAVRRAAEDALARELTQRGLQGIPAYTILPTPLTKDKEAAKAAAEQAGVVGVVSMRALAIGKDVTAGSAMYTGPAYGSYWGSGYYGSGWNTAYDPSYIRTDTIVTVETLVFDLRQDKLVWGGQSETINPENVDAFVQDLVDEAAAELRKEGLVR